MSVVMGMDALSIDSARIRAGSWRGSRERAYLVPLSGAATLTPSTLGRIEAHLRADGYTSVVTAALGPSERDVLLADGYIIRERLHLLRHDLRGLPDRPRRVGHRRGRHADHERILELDRVTFEPFWQLDHGGLHEAIHATPVARVRVIPDPDQGRDHLIGYSVSGRAGGQGYLQRLAVHPDHQREGRARALALDSLHWMRRRGVATAWVNTQQRNDPALTLYLHLGFSPAAHDLAVLQRDLR